MDFEVLERNSGCWKEIWGAEEQWGEVRRKQGVGEDQGHPGEEPSVEGDTEEGARGRHELGGGDAAGREPWGGAAGVGGALPRRR